MPGCGTSIWQTQFHGSFNLRSATGCSCSGPVWEPAHAQAPESTCLGGHRDEVIDQGPGQPAMVRPVVQCTGHGIIFTRIHPDRADTSLILRPRPGWERLRSYMAGLAEPASGRCSTNSTGRSTLGPGSLIDFYESICIQHRLGQTCALP